MPTIAHLERPCGETLDHSVRHIGSEATGSIVANLRSLVADLGQRPIPHDPSVVEALRAVTRDVVRQLPADHPLAGIDVDHDGAALLVRLLAHLARTDGDLQLEG